MTSQEVYESIKERVLSIKDIDANGLSYRSTFSDLLFDSLDYIEIQTFVLGMYNVNICDELFANREIEDIGQLVRYIIVNFNQ